MGPFISKFINNFISGIQTSLNYKTILVIQNKHTCGEGVEYYYSVDRLTAKILTHQIILNTV